MTATRKQVVEILNTEIEMVKNNRHMTATEKEIKIQQLKKLITENK